VKQARLSPLGKKAEKLLSTIMDDMEADAKKRKGKPEVQAKYSLTDNMKVLSRVAQFEAIRSKLETPEGSFFSGREKEDEDGDAE